MATLLEIDYLKRTPNGLLRRQLLECADGWRLSNFELASAGPASLRDYDGGWQSTGRLYATRDAAVEAAEAFAAANDEAPDDDDAEAYLARLRNLLCEFEARVLADGEWVVSHE